MNYTLKPSQLFIEQVNKLSNKTKSILKEKLLLTKIHPFRNKRIRGYNLFLFRIRLQDKNKELRVIYWLDQKEIKLMFILNRKNNYKDLQKYLNKFI